MEKRYISESRYKKSSNRKRRSVKDIQKKAEKLTYGHSEPKLNTIPNTKNNIVKKKVTVKTKKVKAKKQIDPQKERRNNIIVCVILLLIIAVISRGLMKEEGEPFIPISFGVEENETIITVGIITNESLLNKNTSNVIIQELNSYSSNMLLKIKEDYSVEYLALESIGKASNSEYVLAVRKSKEYDAQSIKQMLESHMNNVNSVYYNNVQNIKEIKVDEESNTLRIILKNEDPYYIYNLELPINKTEENIYVLNEASNDSYVTYDRAKDADKTYPKRINVKKYKDMYDAVEAYKKQEINMVITNQKNVQNILGRYEYNIKAYRNGKATFLFANEKSNLLNNKEIRQVIAYSIDRESIVKDVMQSTADVIDLPYVYDITKYKYDIYAAENIMLANGFKKKNKVYTKIENKEQIKLELTLLVNSKDNEKVQIANKIKNNLAAVGISVNIEKLTDKKIAKRVNSGDYDLVLATVNLNKNPNIQFVSKYMCGTENVNIAQEQVKVGNTLTIAKDIQNLQNALSNEIAYIGICASTNYVIYSKNIIGLDSVSFMNVFKCLVD